MTVQSWLVMAQAAPAGGGGGGMLGMLIPFVLMFVIFYFLLIKPQQKRQKEHQELVKRLKAGDRVITTGGIYGSIAGVREKTFLVRIADKVEIEISQGSVAGVVEAETSDAAKDKRKTA